MKGNEARTLEDAKHKDYITFLGGCRRGYQLLFLMGYFCQITHYDIVFITLFLMPVH